MSTFPLCVTPFPLDFPKCKSEMTFERLYSHTTAHLVDAHASHLVTRHGRLFTTPAWFSFTGTSTCHLFLITIILLFVHVASVPSVIWALLVVTFGRCST